MRRDKSLKAFIKKLAIILCLLVVWHLMFCLIVAYVAADWSMANQFNYSIEGRVAHVSYMLIGLVIIIPSQIGEY